MRPRAKIPPTKNPSNFEVLIQGARELGILLGSGEIEQFKKYLAELKVWAQKINLLSRADHRNIILKDFLDSLTTLKYVPSGAYVLDLGSGAGLPGIPMKIVRPDLNLVLLEASQKKFYFLKHVIRLLNLSGTEAHWTEEANALPLFDVVVSRAFGPLPEFASEATRYVKQGGLVLAMKAKAGEAELAECLPTLIELGLEPAFIDRFNLAALGHERTIIALRHKQRST
jgi:16S rRNA (guanine527-N7)-methyltransferase